jgi:hypothetical protein
MVPHSITIGPNHWNLAVSPEIWRFSWKSGFFGQESGGELWNLAVLKK